VWDPPERLAGARRGGRAALLHRRSRTSQSASGREALKASEERFRLLAENAQDVIFRYRLSPTPGFEYISPSATRVVGYTPEEHYANPDLLLRMVYPDDRHVVEGFMEPSQAVGGSLSAMRIRCKDGREIWCESRHKNIYDSEGNPVAIEGIVRDVTERKRAEEALRESERHLRTVVGNAPVVLFATDQKGVYTLAEGKGLEAWGAD
jgi:PAS domain S-box-containing protein